MRSDEMRCSLPRNDEKRRGEVPFQAAMNRKSSRKRQGEAQASGICTDWSLKPVEMKGARNALTDRFAGLHAGDHLVDEAIFQRFLGRHEFVAVGVFLDHLERPAGVIVEDAV